MTMTQIAIPVKHLTSKLLKKAALPADRIFGENLDAAHPRCYGTLEPEFASWQSGNVRSRTNEI
jgi:hypothetical protein